MFAAGMLLASCTDDISPNDPVEPNTDGTSFVKFSLNLPSTTAGGRADEVFDDGKASEYAVANAWLITFIGNTGGNESDATVYEKVELKNLKPWNLDEDHKQVTTEANIVAELSKDYLGETVKDKQFYALILLNSTETMRNKFLEPTESADGTKFSACLKFEDIYDATTNGNPMTFKGTGDVLYYTMSNAPLANVDGATVNAKTLVEIPAGIIKKTAAEANTATPLDIYVERGVAKLTVLAATSFTGEVKNPTKIGDNAGDKIAVTLESWAFDMGNTKSYILHNVRDFTSWASLNASTATDAHRFYGIAPVATDFNDYRIYWAIDPNYSTDVVEADFNKITDESAKWHNFNSTNDEIEYPLENTFDVDHMDQNETSRVVVKATIKPKADGGTPAAEGATPSTLYRVGSSTTLYDYEALKTLVAGVAKTATGNDFAMVDAELDWTMSDGKYNLGINDFAATQPTVDELNAINNALGDIVFFKNGVCYYKILVKHFGDTETPWNGGDYDEAGANKDNMYLGRYGIVRNNWYDLTINSASTIGTPEIPDTPDIQDDEMTSYLNVSCKILSWAKRSQDVTL